MRRQPELLLQVLGQEADQPADRHQMQHRARRTPHEDVVSQLTLYCREEICNKINIKNINIWIIYMGLVVMLKKSIQSSSLISINFCLYSVKLYTAVPLKADRVFVTEHSFLGAWF